MITISDWLNIDVPQQKDEKGVLESFSTLWKTHDDAWMERRKAEWCAIKDVIKEDCKKEELGTYEKYFMLGHKHDYISCSWMLFFTPYNSIEELKGLFGSKLFDASDRKKMLSGYIYVLEKFSGLETYKNKMRIFIEAFFSAGYEVIVDYNGKMEVEISPEPPGWIRSYVIQALNAFDKNQKYSPCFDCLDYFLSILPYATKPKLRKMTKMDKFLELIDVEEIDNNENPTDRSVYLRSLQERKNQIKSGWEKGIR